MKKFIGDIKMFVKCAKHIEYLCKGLVFLHIANAIFNSISPFINIYMAAHIVDMIFAGEPWKETLLMAGITAGLNFFVAIMSAILKYFISVRHTVFNYNYTYSKNHKISEMDYDYVDTVEIQQTLNKIYQYEKINSGGLQRFENNLPTMIGHIFTIIFSVTMTLELFISHYPEDLVGMAKYIVTPYFAIFILAINAFSVWFTSHCHTKNTRFESNETLKFTFINQLASSLLGLPFDGGGAMNIRVYDQENIIKNSLNDAIDGSYTVLGGCADYCVKNEIIPCSIVETATQIILYTFAGISALVGRFSIGSISQYISSIFKFTSAVSALVNSVEMLRVNNEITKIYFDFIERPSHMVQGTLPVEKRDDREYEVEFRDVSFKYPNTDSWALHHVNFKFKIGERLAVVGMNGARYILKRLYTI